MKKWEYKVIFYHELMKLGGSKGSVTYDPNIKLKALNKLGSEGWELVGIEGTHNQPDFYFKREIK
jgi:hypothetical protein